MALDAGRYMSYCSYMQMSVPSLLRDEAMVQALADTFRILGDPTRVRIVDALAPGQLCVHEISDRIGISESAVSHQLRLLRNLRLVRSRREGRMIFYALDDRHIITLFRQALRHVQETRGVGSRAARHLRIGSSRQTVARSR